MWALCEFFNNPLVELRAAVVALAYLREVALDHLLGRTHAVSGHAQLLLGTLLVGAPVRRDGQFLLAAIVLPRATVSRDSRQHYAPSHASVNTTIISSILGDSHGERKHGRNEAPSLGSVED